MKNIALQSWRPSTEVPKPRPDKVPKKCFKRGAEQSAEKCFGLVALLLILERHEARSTFSALSSAQCLGPALSEALFEPLLSGRGFSSTSVDGRQDCRQSSNSSCPSFYMVLFVWLSACASAALPSHTENRSEHSELEVVEDQIMFREEEGAQTQTFGPDIVQ